jgi:hypothetical protein
MLGKGGQLGTHGEGWGGRIVAMGASCAVQQTNKNAAFLGRKNDVVPARHAGLAKIGYQTIAQAGSI